MYKATPNKTKKYKSKKLLKRAVVISTQTFLYFTITFRKRDNNSCNIFFFQTQWVGKYTYENFVKWREMINREWWKNVQTQYKITSEM